MIERRARPPAAPAASSPALRRGLVRAGLWRADTDARLFGVYLLLAAGLIIAIVWPVLAHSDLWAGNGGPILFHVSHAHALHVADIVLVAVITAASWASAAWAERRRANGGSEPGCGR